jgi:SAM-dependent methyltransferase
MVGGERNARWTQVLSHLVSALSPGPRLVVVDGHAHTTAFADVLAQALAGNGQRSVRVTAEPGAAHVDPEPDAITIAAGPRWRASPPDPGWDVVIWLRTPPVPGRDAAEHQAHVVVDLQDPAWPVVRRLDEALADRDSWYLVETQAFFAVRATTWDDKFGDDVPAYAAAVTDADVPPGGVVIDVGCGTGRALPALREAVGPGGTVLGLDVTKQMLETALSLGRAEHGQLILGDARRLPLGSSTVDVVFAAGLISHMPEVEPVLHELARVTVTGGRLALFHPSGRVALAARHGRRLRPDESLARDRLRAVLAATGWELDRYDDAEHRFFARATRCR